MQHDEHVWSYRAVTAFGAWLYSLSKDVCVNLEIRNEAFFGLPGKCGTVSMVTEATTVELR